MSMFKSQSQPVGGVRYVLFLVIVFFTLTLVSQTAVAAPQAIIYVDVDASTGANNGSSWGDAYTSLATALAAASSGDQIWVAAGTYLPGTAEADSFNLVPGVAVYGGFDGSETALVERDWATNLTILSGDIDDNDSKDANGIVTDAVNIAGSNSYHVVFADGTTTPITATTILDGFIITAGQANEGSYPGVAGGGFYCNGEGTGNECSLTLTNIIFSGNTAEDGGGIYNDGSDGGVSNPILTRVDFTGNLAIYGGAMTNDGQTGVASPSLAEMTFSGNQAEYGGAVYNYGADSGNSSPVLTNVIFSNNFSDGSGAMYNDGTSSGVSSPSLTNVSFSDNVATIGGAAIYNDGTDGVSSPSLTNVTFFENSALYGGAMVNDGGSGVSSPSLTNVTFSGNSATDGEGGAMYNEGNSGLSSPSLTNVTFSGNSATTRGGAMYNRGYIGTSSPSLTNVTFSGNSAPSGGAMYNYSFDGGTSSPSLTNVISWGNNATTAGSEIYNQSATLTISYSLIEGGVGGAGIVNVDGSTVTDGGNNLDGLNAPLFVRNPDPGDGDWATPGDNDYGDLRLQVGSPAIDVGDDNAPGLVGILTDLDGNPRKVDGNGDSTAVVDMGAYEYAGVALSMQTDGFFNWTPDFGASCSESLTRSDTPYVGHSLISSDPASYDGSGSLTDVDANYFYYLLVVCGGGSTQSNEVGEFTFGIVPGSP